VTWNTQTSNLGTSTISAVGYGNGVWTVVGAGVSLRTSTNNGVTWNTQGNTFITLGGLSMFTVAYGNSTWVIAGQAGIIGRINDIPSYYYINPSIYTSVDGLVGYITP
jgi:hypothetical protein